MPYEMLGLPETATDEELQAKGAEIMARFRAFMVDLQVLSQKHGVWVGGGHEDSFYLQDEGTGEAASCDRGECRQARRYDPPHSYVLSDPAEYRRLAKQRDAERKLQREERERQLAESKRREAEHEAKMKAEGWQREESRFTHAATIRLIDYGLSSNAPHDAERYVGTAGAWWRPRGYSGGTPNSPENRS